MYIMSMYTYTTTVCEKIAKPDKNMYNKYETLKQFIAIYSKYV